MRWRTPIERFIPYGLYSGLCRALAGCDTVLDIGCGTDSMMQNLAWKHRVIGLDRYLPSLLANRARGRYSGWLQGDLLALPIADRSVDAVVALDVIEHLEKDEGLALLKKLETVARQRVVLLTPNGFVPQPANDNPWQLHKSGWTVGDFDALGYRVSGVYGWKALRGPHARLRRRPRLFWELVSAFSHLITASRPESAFHLLAVKTLDSSKVANLKP